MSATNKPEKISSSAQNKETAFEISIAVTSSPPESRHTAGLYQLRWNRFFGTTFHLTPWRDGLHTASRTSSLLLERASKLPVFRIKYCLSGIRSHGNSHFECDYILLCRSRARHKNSHKSSILSIVCFFSKSWNIQKSTQQ